MESTADRGAHSRAPNREPGPPDKSSGEEPPDPTSFLAEGTMASVVYKSVDGDTRQHGLEVDLTNSYAEVLKSCREAAQEINRLEQMNILSAKQAESLRDNVHRTLHMKFGLEDDG